MTGDLRIMNLMSHPMPPNSIKHRLIQRQAAVRIWACHHVPGATNEFVSKVLASVFEIDGGPKYYDRQDFWSNLQTHHLGIISCLIIAKRCSRCKHLGI
ncbi:MAG TPA: hypothetical protein G4O12_04490 [Dehalococcoidia bacterium]|nr:hypothetical protein [Dehalococcoidia bacterium]